MTVEGLTFLARSMADRERAERSDEPRGFRRRYSKTKNFYVTEALNSLLADGIDYRITDCLAVAIFRSYAIPGRASVPDMLTLCAR
jgi:hypothetical protein